jgi:hypothetical protein
VLETVQRLEEMVVAERFAEVEETLRDLPSGDIRDAALHLRLADLCEAAGLGERLVTELNLAYRDDPSNLDILRRLGHVHADAGRSERALKCWRHVVSRAPTDVETWEELGALLTALARPEEARQTYEQAFEKTGRQHFLALARGLDRPRPEEEAPAPGLADESLLVRFVSLFSGREGVYARQWCHRGQGGYTPIHEPFTLKVAQNHLLGNHTIGVYPIRLDNTVNFAALDFDLPRAALEGPRQRAVREALLRHLEVLVERAAGQDLPVYLEDSGWKGYHAWVFFSEPVTARVARRLLVELTHLAGPPPAGIRVELFPKQPSLPVDGLGNLIKLPLGLHRMTGRRAVFVGPDGAPLADQETYLQSLVRLDREAVHRFLERRAEQADDWTEPPPLEEAEPGAAPREREAPPQYDPEGDIELQLLLSRCATLRALIDRAGEERTLTHDEAMVVVHSVGHLSQGVQAVNSVLRACPEVDPRLYLKSRLRGNPVSCPKIRSRIPHVTSHLPCNCQFPENAGLYPNPLLHLQVAGGSTGELDTLQFQALLADYLRARKALSDAQRLCDKFTARLDRWFDQAGVDEFRTPMGLLRRQRDAQGQTSFQLDV